MAKRILVLGATGLLGEPVAQRLKQDGFDVRVMARDVEKAQAKLGGSFEIMSGDATNIDDIKRAMEGCYGVHLSLAGDAELIGARLVASAAADQGIERITYISGCTALEENRWFSLIETKLQAEEAIKESGIGYTIFAPTWPMEMLTRYARNGKPLLIGKMAGPFHFFAVDDLARMVSTAYQTEETVNKRLIIHGPEGFSFPEALLRYCKVFHPEVEKISSMPVWVVKLMAALMGNDLMRFGAELSGYFDRVGEMGDPTEANHLLGAPTTTLGQWLEQKSK